MSWLLANASVIFDVDSGPKVTHLFPPMLSEEEQRDMAFHSFPVSSIYIKIITNRPLILLWISGLHEHGTVLGSHGHAQRQLLLVPYKEKQHI